MLTKVQTRTILLALVFLLVFQRSLDIVFMIDTTQANIIVNQAEKSLQIAFSEIIKTEDEGINSSELIIELNRANTLLAQARQALKEERFGEVEQYCEACIDIIQSVEAETIALRNQAEVPSGERAHIISISLGVITLLMSLLCWKAFKRYYWNRVLTTNTER
jgi:hypothetical protein